MAVTNSVNQLQENSLTSLTKKINDNKQQVKETMSRDFAQQLAKASSTLDPAAAIASTAGALTGATSAASALDIDFDFSNAAVLSSGLSPTDFLSQSLKGGIETKFNELKNGIAASLIAGLAGKDSATKGSVDATENAPAKLAGGVTTDDLENNADSAKNEQAIASDGLTSDNKESIDEALSAVSSVTEMPEVVNKPAEPSLTSSLFPEAILNLFKSTPNSSLLDKEETNTPDKEQVTSLEEGQDVSQDEQKAVG